MNATVSIPPTEDLVPALQRVQKHIERQRFQEAAEQLNKLARRWGQDARVYLMGTRLAEATGNAKGGVDFARRAVELAPAWSTAQTELAMALARANRFHESVTAADKAVQLDGSNPEVLARVIDVAHRAQNVEKALAWLQRAYAISPDNMHIQRLLARDLRLTGRHADAMEIAAQGLEQRPDDVVLRLERVQAALAAGDRPAALADTAQMLLQRPDDAVAKFWDALARGETPSHQPPAMVAAQYDSFAPVYDQHVVASLKYKLPKLVGERILQWHADRKLNVLDLGCGTGLLGVVLGRIDGALVGVDVSRPMLDQALRHNVYDKLHHVDLREALEATPEGLYDVITALDVFIYAGDLSRAIPDAFRILKPGGRLVLSCERAGPEEAEMVLRPTMRYAHQAAAVEATCIAAGFGKVQVEPVTLREEERQPVEGFLLVATKPA